MTRQGDGCSCMSDVVHAFSLRGKKLFDLSAAAIVSMELLALSKTRTAKAILISLATSEVRLWQEAPDYDDEDR